MNSTQPLNQLDSISEIKQNEAQIYLNSYFNSLGQVLNSEIEPAKSFDLNFEIEFTKRFLAVEGLFVSDDIWATLRDGDVIEIYNLDGIQIFRSFSFFKYCSYTLTDILSQEWFNLWDRPRTIIEAMHNNVGRALESSKSIFKTDVPTHVLRETNMAKELHGVKPKACLVTFKNIAVVSSHPLSRIPKGFICTSTAELIAEGEEAKKIHFV
jgi:hypothetical protein